MKIAFISDAVYPWNVGGLETLENTEAQELAKTYEVHFFSLKWPGMKKDFVKNSIHYHTLHDITAERFYRHGRRSIREAIFYTAGLGRIFFHRFDCIQSNEFPIVHIPLLRLYCTLTGCKFILDVHEVWEKDYWTGYLGGGVVGNLANALANASLKMADAYIANSSMTAEGLKRLGIDSNRIRIFSPVIDDKKLSSIKTGKVKNRVIFSGRLIKEKRLDKWLKAVKSASGSVRGIKAVIIGEGPEKNSIKRLISRLKIDHIVKMHDFYHGEDKDELYKSIKESKLLLQMSEREGLSIIVLESIALGTPVLLPESSPIPDEVKEMCVVKEEISIPYELEKILKSNDKGEFIRNIHGIEKFSTSNTNRFYSELFKTLRK
ncbi:MAG: glycosyltransferase family 4 protein [Candidatus Micrarchaeaceae archaeon]